MYRQLLLFNSAASRNAASIHAAGKRPSASRNWSATSGVIAPTFCSYNAKILGAASPVARGSGSSMEAPLAASASSDR